MNEEEEDWQLQAALALSMVRLLSPDGAHNATRRDSLWMEVCWQLVWCIVYVAGRRLRVQLGLQAVGLAASQTHT